MFEKRLQDIQRLQTQGMNSQAIKECSTIIEQVLEKFYKDIWAYLNTGEKQRLTNIESKFSKRRTPIETLGLGRWINFYEESKLPKLLERYLRIDSLAFDFGELAKMNETRNKCTHENYDASQDECKEIYNFTTKLLKKTGLIKREPVGIRHATEEKARPKYQVWADKIRLLLASDPLFEIQEVIEADFGKFYDVLGKWEFVGAVAGENIVRILLLEDDDSGYHEDVMDDVSEMIVKLVKERIKEKLPQSHGIKIEVSVTDNIDSWGNYSAELEL